MRAKIGFAGVACLLPSMGFAQEESSLTVYGRIDLGIQYRTGYDGSVGAGQGFPSEVGEFVLKRVSRNRFGIRGTENLGHGYSAQFRLDASFDGNNGMGQSPFFNGESTVGLSHELLGKIDLGRKDNPAMTVVLDVDPWVGESVAQTGAWVYSRLPNDPRAAVAGDASAAFKVREGITYQSSYSKKLRIMAQYGFADDPGDGYGGAIKYEDGPLYMGAGYHRWREGDWSAPAGVVYDFGLLSLAATYTIGGKNSYVDDNANNQRIGSYIQRAYSVAVIVPLGRHRLRGAYVVSRDDSRRSQTVYAQPYDKWDQKISVGYSYIFSKRTSVNLNVAHIEYGNGDGTGAFDFGIRHRF